MLAKRLFDLAPVRLALASVVALVLLLGTQARAEDPHFIHELKLGLLGHDQSFLISHSRREKHLGLDFSADITFTPYLSVPYFGGKIRPALGATFSPIGTNLGYIDARYEIEGPFRLPSNLFFMLGLGAAIHNGNQQFEAEDRKAFGTRVLFHIPAEMGWRFDHHHSVALYFEHVSNANLGTPNEGMDNMGVRYGYRF
jgi:lipid A 3-O-deacylase